ncbi:MAG: hypothetical protein ABIC04_00020 [Nanoarchaeota archaeon]
MVNKKILTLNIIIAVILIFAVSHLLFNSVIEIDKQKTHDDIKYEKDYTDKSIKDDEVIEDPKEKDNNDIIITIDESESEETNDPKENSETQSIPVNFEEGPTDASSSFALLGFETEIIDSELAKVNSLSYKIRNQGIGLVNLELLIYVYDEDDDSSVKGLVKDQISIGQLDYQDTVEDTVSVDAFYNGDISTEKTIKLTLIGYVVGASFNLASVSEEFIFK